MTTGTTYRQSPLPRVPPSSLHDARVPDRIILHRRRLDLLLHWCVLRPCRALRLSSCACSAACVAGYYCPSVGLTTYTANRASGGGAWCLARCVCSMHGRQLLPGWRVCDDWCACAARRAQRRAGVAVLVQRAGPAPTTAWRSRRARRRVWVCVRWVWPVWRLT